MEIIKVENLSFTYPACSDASLRNVSFSVRSGEFISICGSTGSGKSTLLRLMKKELSPLGEKSGEIYFSGTPLSQLDSRTSASSLGFVMQKPEQQIVTDKVWHELAFGLENLGVQPNTIHSRIAEMAAFFGIEQWFEKNTAELSGGQKQLLNLAAVMSMHPDVLILDEPTAQLDPIAASDFIATLKKLNRELGLTVIIAEHRLEEIIPVSDRLMVIENGEITYFDTPKNVAGSLGKSRLISFMPAAARLYHMVGGGEECPLDVRGGREFIRNNFRCDIKEMPQAEYSAPEKKALEFKNVCFRYDRYSPDILNNLCFDVYEGELFCILGGNGSGKTTTLNAAAGLIKPYSGTIKVFGKNIGKYKNQTLYRECVSMLPQDVQTLFLKSTLGEELKGAEDAAASLPLDFEKLYSKHPYDLSGGEQQLAAIAKVLAAKPKIILMDEPTKGLDANSKQRLTEVLKKLKSDGITIIAVTHDAEFAAVCADRCALFFRGCIAAEGTPSQLFSENSFYTTAASRMTNGYYCGAVTTEDAAELCRLNGRRSE